MKRLLIMIIGLSLICGKVYAWKANFNYGKDTYEKWDNMLIINSLGDETVESQFNYKNNKLGYNDYIPENAFKNNLYNEGYSKVYDFNNPHLNLTEVGYMGRLGNPRSYDKDYVLTSEWQKYSSQYQDIRISNNKEKIRKNKKRIVDVNNKHTAWNHQQDVKISNNKNKTITNSNKIITNRANINKNLTKINNNSNKINDLNNKINKLEETQYIVGIEGRVYDSRKWQVNMFADYSTNRNKFDRVGIKFKFKFGSSFEEKQINELKKRIEKLENK